MCAIAQKHMREIVEQRARQKTQAWSRHRNKTVRKSQKAKRDSLIEQRGETNCCARCVVTEEKLWEMEKEREREREREKQTMVSGKCCSLRRLEKERRLSQTSNQNDPRGKTNCTKINVDHTLAPWSARRR